jgi:predicted O-linked N-acetylglucosamine transferase (SPINDLY family)
MSEGTYDLQLEVLGIGDIVLDTIPFSGVSVQKGKKTFLIAR